MRSLACQVFAALMVTCSALPCFAEQESVGVTGAVNPQAVGQPPAGKIEQLAIGQNVVRNEKISTFNKGQVQLIFSDQSTLTLGENSEIVIDEFVYDPQKQAGSMTATVTTGVLRYVGGKISKKNDVSFLTPSGVVTVRGGIALIKVTEKPGVAAAKAPVTADKR
jgi:trimeric autotransporter adhesin